MKVKEVAHTLIDVIAAHQLLGYFKPADKTRIISGITLGALGYGLGPELESYVREADDGLATEIARQDVIYAASGAALGAFTGYVTGNDLAPKQQSEGGRSEDGRVAGTQQDDVEIIQRISLQDKETQKPNGLYAVVAGGWLGYSLFVAEKDDTFKSRQQWGLGAGSLGYLAGPSVLSKMQDVLVPNAAAEDGIKVYQRGSALVGGLLGAGGGLYLSKKRRK